MMAWVHVLVTTYLVGLIWTIQVVHYPSFAFIDPDSFVAFHRAHNRWISMIVMVPMILELGLAGVGAVKGGTSGPWLALAGVVGVWAVTFLVIVPIYNQLGQGFDLDLIRRLVRTNWVRTGLWTLEWGVLVMMMVRSR